MPRGWQEGQMPRPHDDRIADLREQIRRKKAAVAKQQREIAELDGLRRRLAKERARINKRGESDGGN